jgi:exopolysaccharide biosynthesis protein
MLIHNNAIKITDKEELISINNTTSRPRSAIGFNSNGIMMLLAVEGDNATAGYNGLSLLQLANLMQTFGLSNAMNLDGGGSTSLILNNQPTVRPGDNGVERPVVSAILLKRK